MKQVEVHQYYLPPRPGAGPRAKPYLSRWKMTADEAKALNAVRPEPASREVREVPETEEERRRAQTFYQSAGRDSVKPPKE